MRPKVLKVDPLNVDREILRQAVEVIHNRGLVAFPTETVYGLGANAFDSKAVAGIFEAKKRPLDDPLIVHISKIEDLSRIAGKIPSKAHRLIERFWPGPLTLVLKKTDLVPDIVTTGLDTIAVRMPSNSVARELIELAEVPLAAPSANLFGRPSPTKAKHVVNDLEGRIDLVLDGGPTEIGIESTVVELVGKKTIILRPGGTDLEVIKELVGEVEVSAGGEEENRSPGKYPQHYSPQALVTIVEEGPQQVEEVIRKVDQLKNDGKKVGIMAKQEHEEMFNGHKCKVLGPALEARTCASRLFHLLREFDEEKIDVIVSEGIAEEGIGLAVMNRLRKAAGPENSTCENYSQDNL